jgi:hypothetical protein
MPKTLEEIFADLNDFVGTDTAKATELATVLRERLKTVSQVLINVGAKLGKREQASKITELEGKLAEAKEQLEATQQEFAGYKERTPNVRDVEENEKRKWEPRLQKEKERAEKAEQHARNLRLQVFRDKFASYLTRADQANVRVDDDPLIIRALVEQYVDRYVQNEDGSEEVLQIDNDTPYDGRTLDDKIAALAQAARRNVSSKFLIAATDTGSGVRGPGGGTSNGGLLTQEQVIERRRVDPAFSGL